ncbi:MAG TPA: hypothetical protein VF103_00710 [Polyangiaceae bacterium]
MRGSALCLAVILVACDNREATPSHSGRMGCATFAAAWADQGALACPESLQSYCSSTVHCPVRDLSDAFAMQNEIGSPPNIYVCGAYHYVDDDWVCGKDGKVYFVYATDTGKLVAAIEESSADDHRQACVGGPSVVEPLDFRSCTDYFDCLPNDAGYDPRHCFGAGGAAGGAP